MRRDLVEAALGDIASELFEDVLYTHAPAAAVTVSKAIFGVEIVSERPDFDGYPVRAFTHVARALKAKFPDLASGDIIRDGTAPDFADGTDYRVVDFEPAGDGRFEIRIALTVA